MIKVKINDVEYEASVAGLVSDSNWDGRESKAITMSGDYETVNGLFTDGTAWSIVHEYTEPAVNDAGEAVIISKRDEFNNSDFCVRGDLTVHTDGTCTVKMGKFTDLENAYAIMYGGV